MVAAPIALRTCRIGLPIVKARLAFSLKLSASDQPLGLLSGSTSATARADPHHDRQRSVICHRICHPNSSEAVGNGIKTERFVA
jgi:hypothetical protein